MKKPVLLFSLLCAMAFQARAADLVIIYSAAFGPEIHDVTIEIKGNKAAFIVPDAKMKGFIDFDTGDITGMSIQTKMFMKIPGAKLKEIGNQLKQAKAAMGGDADPTMPKIVDSGKKEKANGFDSEMYTADTQMSKTTIWMSKDVPGYAVILEQVKKLQVIQDILSTRGVDFSKIEGLPIKIITLMSDDSIALNLVSIKEEAVADVDFQIPAGFTEVPMPNLPMPGAARAPGAGPAVAPQAPPAPAPAAPAVPAAPAAPAAAQ